MIKRKVKYINAFGEEVEDTLYFNMSQLEQTRLTARYTSGDEEKLQDYIDKITKEKNNKEILGLLEDVILSSYGERTEDGKGFNKNPKVREAFEYSFAYAELFEQLVLNPEQMKSFIEGVMKKQAKKEN